MTRFCNIVFLVQGPVYLITDTYYSEGEIKCNRMVYHFSAPEHEVLMVSYCDRSLWFRDISAHNKLGP